MLNNSFKKSALFCAVMVALAAIGLFLNPTLAHAADVLAKVGDTVEVKDGDVVVVEAPTVAPKTTTVKISQQLTAGDATYDEFASTSAPVAEPADTTSSVELAARFLLTPSGPLAGGSVGFSYRPADRVRLYGGFNIAKGLLDLAGADKELVAFGFTAGASKLLTLTVEIGAFASASWSYRDLVRQTSASFVGAGPGFRVNKFGAFFQTSLMLGWAKQFAQGDWGVGSTLEAGVGFHF